MAASAREPSRNLVSLNELDDFKIADEDPDPRGWEVIARDGRRIGEVDELVVDTSAMKVRYLDCDLDEAELGMEARDRHILIPTGHARLNESDKKVFVDAVSSSEVVNLPPYTGDLSPDYDERFAAAGGGVREPGEARAGRPEEAGREVRIQRTEEELAIGKREREAGEARIRKEVEVEHERRPVTRRHEEVEIERRPVEGARARGEEPGEEEYRIPLREEEIVTEKRPVTKEEMVVRKRPVEEEVEVEAELRKERIDIERGEERPGGRDRPRR